MMQMNLFTKQKQAHRHRKQTGLTKGRGEGVGIWSKESGVSRYTLLYVK